MSVDDVWPATLRLWLGTSTNPDADFNQVSDYLIARRPQQPRDRETAIFWALTDYHAAHSKSVWTRDQIANWGKR